MTVTYGKNFEKDAKDIEEKEAKNLEHTYGKFPSEDYIVNHTLWPEVNKLYGHGYEMSCLATNHSGNLIASACKSQKKEFSHIILWNPFTYNIIDKLELHRFTIMQLVFSKND